MTDATNDEPNDNDQLRQRWKAAILRAEATSALAITGARYAELFAPTLLEHLRITDDGVVTVVDDDGERRSGMTPLDAATELRKRYPTL